jgi:hypothetical protein
MAVVAKKNRSMEVSHGREEEKKTGARASGLRCFVRAANFGCYFVHPNAC